MLNLGVQALRAEPASLTSPASEGDSFSVKSFLVTGFVSVLCSTAIAVVLILYLRMRDK